MFRCSNCDWIVTQETKCCPHCGIILKGIRCSKCQKVSTEEDFRKNGNRCPHCNQVHSLSIAPLNDDMIDKTLINEQSIFLDLLLVGFPYLLVTAWILTIHVKEFSTRDMFESTGGLFFIGVLDLIILFSYFKFTIKIVKKIRVFKSKQKQARENQIAKKQRMKEIQEKRSPIWSKDFYCIVHKSMSIDKTKEYYNFLIDHYKEKPYCCKNELYIELSLVSDKVPIIILSGNWTIDDGLHIPDVVALNCRVYSESANALKRKSEYFNYPKKQIESIILFQSE